MDDGAAGTGESPSRAGAPAIDATGRLTGAVRALKHRNFRLFAGGQLISLIGTWMDSVAESGSSIA